MKGFKRAISSCSNVFGFPLNSFSSKRVHTSFSSKVKPVESL